MESERKHDVASFRGIRPSDASTKDAGKVRLGGQSPSLPPVRMPPRIMIDNGKVRLGGQTPAL
jgi:hypothetical protein